ncbi:MAG: nucleotide sugar dehydrogenase [Acidobacteria bacterium]|nr:nucleotide sugar dehydrogenase [Acidobacteriota bacterium]MBI3658056.1 nucleotide sugar dehydrogenase [Acidobacteriota bacterium]
MHELEKKLRTKTAVVSVIGLGYVGLPLITEFARSGFRTVGFDVDESKVDRINRGESYITDVPADDLRALVKDRRLRATGDREALRAVDTISICVPTPLRKTKDPDISFVLKALDVVKSVLHPGMLIVLESTTYPGTTNELALPELESTGLKVGKDFCLAFSPERIDPGNKQFVTKTIPKVMGGVTPTCTQMAKLLYEAAVDKVIPVSSPRIAEMVKLLENTFRAVNIGLVNEMAIMCNKLGLDTWEIIEAAATKPFGFMKFTPGPGLGGECIPVDPHYLSWKLKMLNYTARFIELASEVNSHMPDFVVEKVAFALNNQKKCLNGSRILVLGVTYKKDVVDIRESPIIHVINLLRKHGACVEYHDPYIHELVVEHGQLTSQNSTANPTAAQLAAYDCVVIGTDHSSYDYKAIVENAQLIVDTRNATSVVRGLDVSHVVKL